MRRYLAVLILLLCAERLAAQPATVGSGAAADKIAEGFYEIAPADAAATTAKKYVYISKAPGGALTLKDLATANVLEGAPRSDGSIRFRKSRGLASVPEEFTLSGSPSDGLDGIWTGVSGLEGSLAIHAFKLVSVWECGNHPSPHLAGSEGEMREDEAKYSCQRWHRVQTPK